MVRCLFAHQNRAGSYILFDGYNVQILNKNLVITKIIPMDDGVTNIISVKDETFILTQNR